MLSSWHANRSTLQARSYPVPASAKPVPAQSFIQPCVLPVPRGRALPLPPEISSAAAAAAAWPGVPVPPAVQGEWAQVAGCGCKDEQRGVTAEALRETDAKKRKNDGTKGGLLGISSCLIYVSLRAQALQPSSACAGAKINPLSSSQDSSVPGKQPKHQWSELK